MHELYSYILRIEKWNTRCVRLYKFSCNKLRNDNPPEFSIKDHIMIMNDATVAGAALLRMRAEDPDEEKGQNLLRLLVMTMYHTQ